MKKFGFASMFFCSLFVSTSWAGWFKSKDVGFKAPAVNGPGSFTYAEPGAIIFDITGGKFYGNTSSTTTPTWTLFGGNGTVTSVGLSLPNIFSTSGSPITSSGTISASLVNQNANLVFAGPSSGTAAAPAFRQLVLNDLLLTSKAQTGDYPVLATDDYVTGDASGGAFTLTLPSANTVPKGKILRLIKTDSSFNQIGVSRASSSSDTINGAISTVLSTQYETIHLMSDGNSAWYLIGRSYPKVYTSYTPTFSDSLNNPTVSSCKWIRIDDSTIEVHFRIVTGASTTSSEARIGTPSDLQIAGNGSTVTGSAWAQGTVGTDVYVIGNSGNTFVTFILNNGGGSTLTGSNFGNSKIIDGWFRVKINGWSG